MGLSNKHVECRPKQYYVSGERSLIISPEVLKEAIAKLELVLAYAPTPVAVAIIKYLQWATTAFVQTETKATEVPEQKRKTKS